MENAGYQSRMPAMNYGVLQSIPLSSTPNEENKSLVKR